MKIKIHRKDLNVFLELTPHDLIYLAERVLQSPVLQDLLRAETFKNFIDQFHPAKDAEITEHESGGLDDAERLFKSKKVKENVQKEKNGESSKKETQK